MSRRPASRPPAQPTVSLISLGCPRTLVDSEFYLGKLQQAGFHVLEQAEGSDVVVINTCSFIQDSVRESIDTVLRAVELKKQGKIKAVVVAGCLVQRFKQELITELPDVDGFVGVDGFGDIQAVAQRALRGEPGRSLRARPQTMSWEQAAPRVALTPAHYAYLKVSEGCLKGCSFCVIPKIKGPLVSRPFEALREEARRLVEERGVKELIVVGQDTSDYGVDLDGRPRISELLRALGRINGLRWIRLLYCHPRGISPELVEAIREEPKVCKYLDTAIEHADEGMLQRMNRGITQARLRETIGTLRAAIPGLVLRSAVIVGFPGETEAAFEELVRFLREIRFERLGAFVYSPEQGSASIRFPDPVPAAVRDQRFDRLMQAQQEIAAAVNRRWIGRTCDVLIDEAGDEPGQYLGRSSADCPEVDGLVYVRSEHPLAPGDLVPVMITDSYEYDLTGTYAGLGQGRHTLPQPA